MTTALAIPEKGQVPAYILNPELARKANEDALMGISTGMPPRIKMSGKQFTLIDGDGTERAYPPAKLIPAEDGNVYMPVIVLRAKKALSKAWYATKYMPGQDDYKAPDCWSNDAEKPDASVAVPQSDLCATCHNNAFGSGTDQNGNPTKGKACSDAKILAVFIPQFGVHQFKLPPASLKNFGVYVKKLSDAGIPIGTVKTLVGFDLTVENPVMVFQFGGFLPVEYLPKLDELSQSMEVTEIVQPMAVPKAPALAAPEPAKTTAPPVAEPEDLGLGDPAPPPPAPAPKPRGRQKPKETPVAAAPPPPVDDFGLDLGLGGQQETQAELMDDVSDDQLRKELGL